MLVKTITLTFNSTAGEFDDGLVRDFLKDKEIISINNYHFVRNEIPYLTFVFTYYPHRPEADPNISKDDPWSKTLSPADYGLYNLLRDWRKDVAKKEGTPPYVIFKNEVLAEIVKRRPQSKAELMKINGIGNAKSAEYGDEILKILGNEPQQSEPTGTASETPPEKETAQQLEMNADEK